MLPVTTLPVSIETDAVTDAAKMLARARANLAANPRCDPPAIMLAAKLDALARTPWRPGWDTLPEGVMIMKPPVLWTQLLIEARVLGVI